MNSLKAEPNPFEQSFKINTRESSASLQSANMTSGIQIRPEDGSKASQTPLSNAAHESAVSLLNDQSLGEAEKIRTESSSEVVVKDGGVLGQSDIGLVPNISAESGRVNAADSIITSVFESIPATGDPVLSAGPKETPFSEKEVVPVSLNIQPTNTEVASLEKVGQDSNILTAAEKNSSIIPSSINNNLHGSKKFMGLSFLKDNISAGGLSNGNLSPWPFGSTQVSNVSPGLTTPDGRRIDLFSNNLPFFQPAQLNQPHKQPQNLVNFKNGGSKVKLTPGPGNTISSFQKNPLSPQEEFSKHLAPAGNKPTQPHPQSNSLSVLQSERLPSANGLNSPVSFLNNIGFSGGMLPGFSLSGMNTPLGGSRTGLTPRILNPSNLSSGVVNANGQQSNLGYTLNPESSVVEVKSELGGEINGLELAKELKREAVNAPKQAKKRGRKPASKSVKKPKKEDDLDSMTITDIKHHPGLTEEEKRQGILEKNRIAAFNFRQRKKEFIKIMERKVDFYEREYNETSDLYRTILGGDGEMGLLLQLKAILADPHSAPNPLPLSLVDEAIRKIRETSYYQRNGQNPFAGIDD